MKVITGGVTAAKGFQAASTAAGIKYQGRTDMAMVYSEKPCVAAGTFTTNIVKAAPVKWDQEIVYKHPSAQVIVCNSGIANACTGEEGFSYCRATAKTAYWSHLRALSACSFRSRNFPTVSRQWLRSSRELWKPETKQPKQS